MTPTATLAGTWRLPHLVLGFNPNTPIPHGVRLPAYPRPQTWGRRAPVSRPHTLLDWVRQLPGRRFDREHGHWIVTDPGPEPDRVLAQLGFEVDLTLGARRNVRTLADLASPIIRLDPSDEWSTLIWPRFAQLGSALPAGAVWDDEAGLFRVDTTELCGSRPGLDVPADVKQTAALLHARAATSVRRPCGSWPQAFARLPRAPKRPAPGMAALPPWWGRDLFGYQVAGAYAVAGGHSLLADEPGLGKTTIALAAHAIVGTRRQVVVAPPVAITNWAREASECGHKHIVTIVPGRKVPVLPAAGVVVVPDSLLASRAELVTDLIDWNPDGLIVDEVHRLKSWASQRSQAVRCLARRVTGLRVALSGTPMLANVAELPAVLAITGHLEATFGGLSSFLRTYARPDGRGGWTTRKRTLEALRTTFDEQVWVRRTKKAVFAADDGPRMPSVRPPEPVYADVDLTQYDQVLAEQHASIDDWLDRLRRTPTADDIDRFAAGAIGFISPLRHAAGLAKVGAATERIAAWTREHQDRPLLVWVHHNDVAEALTQASKSLGLRVAALRGGMSSNRRGVIVEEFQSGAYDVLICSLHAAGVAVTLTRSSDNLIVESDWTPAILSQARDRTSRLGQTRTVTTTVLLARDTIDEHMQQVQRAKADDLDVLLGDRNGTAVMDGELATPRAIVRAMIMEQIAPEHARRVA